MHTSELRWADVAQVASEVAQGLVEQIQRAEERYQELLEAYNFSGTPPSDTTFAELLFETSTPTQAQIDMARDVRLAMVAAHDAYVALDFGALRRMS